MSKPFGLKFESRDSTDDRGTTREMSDYRASVSSVDLLLDEGENDSRLSDKALMHRAKQDAKARR
jgi:hypothetical protein